MGKSAKIIRKMRFRKYLRLLESIMRGLCLISPVASYWRTIQIGDFYNL